MVDYSRAATSRAAKSSFDQAAQSLVAEIQALQAEYETEWKKVEELRKSRASLIENVIPILKSNEVKLERPLSKCDNSELMEELRSIVKSLDTVPQEEVKVAMVRIESRYNQLVKQAKKLDTLYERLSSYYVPEKDYGDEVVVSLKGYKKKKAEDIDVTLLQEEPSLPENNSGDLVLSEQIEVPQERDAIMVAPEIAEVLMHVEDDETPERLDEPASDLYDDYDTQPIELEIDETPLFSGKVSDTADDLATFGIPEISLNGDSEELTLNAGENYKKSTDDMEDYLSSDDIDFDAMNDYLGSMSNGSIDYSIDNLGSIFQTDDFADEYVESQSNNLIDELEQVISSSPASQELIEEAASLVDSKKLLDDFDNSNASQLSDNKVIPLLANAEAKNDEKSAKSADEEPEFHTYALNSDQTLSQIVDYVYEGNITWHDLYRYADNEEVISKRCEEKNIDVEDAVNTPGVLADLEIKYPKNFAPYREDSMYYSKAA